jgi:hypothetical protein
VVLWFELSFAFARQEFYYLRHDSSEDRALEWDRGLIFVIHSFHKLFFFAVLGLELRAYTLSHSTSPIFVMGFFEIGSHELFAQAGFES